MTYTFGVFGLVVAALLVPPLGRAQGETVPGAANSRGPIATVYNTFPLPFERNQGQSEKAVQFLARGTGYTVFLTATEAVLMLRQPPEAAVWQSSARRLLSTANSQRSTIRIQIVGGNPHSKGSGEEELPGRVNYLQGDNPQHWRTNIPTYAKVKYEAVYPGIDLLYYGTAHHLESDFVVAPGADPHVIRLALTVLGEDRETPALTIAANGDLILKTNDGEARMHTPRIYQEIKGKRQRVPGHYVLHGPTGRAPTRTLPDVGFEIAAYDSDQPLVIDPVFTYATYVGGKFNERAWGIAVDAVGSAYVTGEVVSPDFPIVQPIQRTFGGGDEDVFVTKLNPAGTAVVYSTYLGGRGADVGLGLAVDPAENIYVTGQTKSTNFPTAHALQSALRGPSDAFVAKLNASGALVYATYLGGSGEENFSYDGAIAADGAGNAYVTGKTGSSDFPTVHPLQSLLHGPSDAFVVKIDATGDTFVSSTYLGGSGEDEGRGIAVNGAGDVYLTGFTDSSDFPTVHPLQPRLGGFQG
jgi:hypothetical protein